LTGFVYLAKFLLAHHQEEVVKFTGNHLF